MQIKNWKGSVKYLHYISISGLAGFLTAASAVLIVAYEAREICFPQNESHSTRRFANIEQASLCVWAYLHANAGK